MVHTSSSFTLPVVTFSDFFSKKLLFRRGKQVEPKIFATKLYYIIYVLYIFPSIQP